MLSTDVTQERAGAPSTCTVQAPHSAMPQPNFVPVMPSTSRSTHSKGVSPSTSTERFAPFILSMKAMCHSIRDQGEAQVKGAMFAPCCAVLITSVDIFTFLY